MASIPKPIRDWIAQFFTEEGVPESSSDVNHDETSNRTHEGDDLSPATLEADLATHATELDDDYTVPEGSGTVLAGPITGSGSISGDGKVAVFEQGQQFSGDVNANGFSVTNADKIAGNTLEADNANITDESLVLAGLSDDWSHVGGSSEKIPFDILSKDERDEFNTTDNKFVPDETGWYFVKAKARVESPTDGEQFRLFFTDDTSGDDVLVDEETTGSSQAQTIRTGGLCELTGGNDYIIKFKSGGSETIVSKEAATRFSVRGAFR